MKVVLLVEDSPGDVRLTREAFRDAAGAIDLRVAADEDRGHGLSQT